MSVSSGVLAEIDLFLCTAARLFYPVHVVVVLDAMCRIDGGVRDDVLSEQLKLNASQVREALMTLYEEKILVHSHVKMERNGLSTKNQKVFYLSRKRAINTIRFRLHRMHDLVDEQIRSANEIGAYSCAQCKATYSDFDYGRIFDARTQSLRCASCGGALEERNKVSEDEVVLKRLLNEQTEALRQADLAIKHVPVPPMAKDVVLSLSGVVVQADTRYLPEQGDASYADRVLAARNRLRARKNDNAITLPDAASMPQVNTIVVNIEKDDGSASASALAAAAASESAKKRVHFLDGSRAPSAAGPGNTAADAGAALASAAAAGEQAASFDESTLMAYLALFATEAGAATPAAPESSGAEQASSSAAAVATAAAAAPAPAAAPADAEPAEPTVTANGVVYRLSEVTPSIEDQMLDEEFERYHELVSASSARAGAAGAPR